jgi:hypothetical protein
MRNVGKLLAHKTALQSRRQPSSRRGLIPFLQDAENSVLAAFLKKDKLVVERRTFDLDYVMKNNQKGVDSDGKGIIPVTAWKINFF